MKKQFNAAADTQAQMWCKTCDKGVTEVKHGCVPKVRVSWLG